MCSDPRLGVEIAGQPSGGSASRLNVHTSQLKTQLDFSCAACLNVGQCQTQFALYYFLLISQGRNWSLAFLFNWAIAALFGAFGIVAIAFSIVKIVDNSYTFGVFGKCYQCAASAAAQHAAVKAG